MTLIVDTVGIRGSGAAMVAWNILKRWQKTRPFQRILAYFTPEASRSFPLPNSDETLICREAPFANANPATLMLWQQVLLPKLCLQEDAQAVLCLANIGARRPAVPQFVYLHQALFFDPSARAWLSGKDALLIWLKRHIALLGLKSCRHAIVQTEAMKQAVLKACPDIDGRITSVWTGIPDSLPGNTHPIPGAVVADSAAALRSLPRPLLFYPTHPASYKNIDLLINGMDLLRNRGFAGTLALTFDPPSVYSGTAERLVARWGENIKARHLSERIRFVGALSPSATREAIALADAFIFPSWAESFPQALAEALGAGAAMALADRPYAREIAGDAAMFFAPDSPESFAQCIRKLTSEPGTRDMLKARALEQAGRLSYDKAAERIASIIQQGSAT